MNDLQLNRASLPNLSNLANINLPADGIFELPEKVLQFGTGVLLRGLPDYFIDKANKQGIFNGRVVVVKSTDSDSSAFDKQDGLYTVCVRGVENGETIQENIVNASISRVISAKSDWEAVLKCAHNPELKIVISNTTEVGIQLVEGENIYDSPPESFPGKLLAFLVERYKAFEGSNASGMVILPTELITNNGSSLKAILITLAERAKLDASFLTWLNEHNHFCNTLVDRIVPGKPRGEELELLNQELGFKDAILTKSEVFRLWAIEGKDAVKEVLSFAKVDDGVKIVPDITLFKELKLRLLNGTHSFNCGLAFLSGFNITREAVLHPVYSVFSKKLMQEEIANAIPYEIDSAVKEDFANKVFERFCNPFINHQWLSITVQYTSKMRMRNVPLLQHYAQTTGKAAPCMALGFAAYLLFMKPVRKTDDGKFYGSRNGVEYLIDDDAAAMYHEAWAGKDSAQLAAHILGDAAFWGADLSALPGFLEAVQTNMQHIETNGGLETVAALIED